METSGDLLTHRRGGARPEILFLTGHLPYPPVSGGRRREFELITRLAPEFGLHLFVSSKTFQEDAANASALRELCASVHVWPAGTGAPTMTGGRSPELVRRAWSEQMADAVEERLRSEPISVVHVERFHLMPHVPPSSEVPVVLVEQNIEYGLWRQRLARAQGRRERRRFFQEYVATLQAEIDAWRRADICGAVTEEDRATMLAALPDLDVRIIPHGVELPAIGSGNGSDPAPEVEGSDVVAFVANFAYAPNADGAVHLCRDVLPRIQAARPSAKLLLVGNDPPPEVLALRSPDVIVTGRVPAVEPYLDRADVVVCPLREGGGIKVKILEALAREKPVVTTPVGAQGFGPDAADVMRIAEGPDPFAHAVVELLADPEERTRLGKAGSRLVAALPTWDEAALRLATCYRDVLAPAAGR
ncbi:MAG TPA: glycosyltransferase family 4 protein [Actinomycetota bacterium]|nr:glycosyltransferase family 4 protein [Actinomycetota bacterium]